MVADPEGDSLFEHRGNWQNLATVVNLIESEAFFKQVFGLAFGVNPRRACGSGVEAEMMGVLC